MDAADYLLYPVGYDRFAAAMRRANARLARKQGGAFIVKVKGVYRRLLARDSLAVLGAEEPPAGAKEREDVAADARE